jgi:hypothetical protein
MLRCIAAVLALAAASPERVAAQGADEAEGDAVRAGRAALVQVTSNHPDNVWVYVVSGGQRHRLGTVTSFTSALFKLPSTWLNRVNDLQLVAVSRESRQIYASGPLLVAEGDVVDWELETYLLASRISVWTPS